MNLKRILALLGVIILVGLYLAAFFLAIFQSPLTMPFFLAAIASTIAVPIIIHLFLMMVNVRKGKSVVDNPYDYKDPQ